MSAEYREPFSDRDATNRHPTSELWGQWGADDEDDTQPYRAVSPSSEQGQRQDNQQPHEQFVHREHVTGALPAYPADAPLFRPAYMPYPSQQGQQGYAPVQQPFPGQSYALPQQSFPGQGYPPQPAQQPWYPPYNAQSA